MTDKLSTQHQTTFDSIRQFDADGNEFWLARPLAKVLDQNIANGQTYSAIQTHRQELADDRKVRST